MMINQGLKNWRSVTRPPFFDIYRRNWAPCLTGIYIELWKILKRDGIDVDKFNVY